MSLPNSPEFVVAEEATAAPKGTTIDLQGVASFAGLVEVIAQELGTSSGKMLGHLPSGPAAFNQLVGEIEISKQGFTHKLVLAARPGSPLSLRFQTQYNDGRPTDGETPSQNGTNITLNPNSVTADFYLGATVEQILPQARALARYAEDVFAVLDRMVGLGGAVNRPAGTVSSFDIQAFEASEGSLVRPAKE